MAILLAKNHVNSHRIRIPAIQLKIDGIPCGIFTLLASQKVHCFAALQHE